VNIELPSEKSLNRLAPDKSRTNIFLPMGTIADRKQNITVGCLYDFAFSPMDKLKEEYLEGDKPKINDTIVGAYDMYTMTKN